MWFAALVMFAALVAPPARALVAPRAVWSAPGGVAGLSLVAGRRRAVRCRGVAADLTTNHMATLARLASNLKNIRLEDIEEVVVTVCDGTHLELQVMTCEDDGCACVLVPVAFADACDDGADFEECVVDNVARLGDGNGHGHVCPST